jgi:hypothetical protein
LFRTRRVGDPLVVPKLGYSLCCEEIDAPTLVARIATAARFLPRRLSFDSDGREMVSRFS